MGTLGHGSDLTLAPAVGPLVRGEGLTVREAIEAVAQAQFTSIQLDASLAGLRPRELDQRARKDLLALLKRRGLRLAGWDLFIPPRHYLDDSTSDRAWQATLGAVELAADTERRPLSLTLPVSEVGDEARSMLIEAADRCGVRLAWHAEDQLQALAAAIQAADVPVLGAGVDPAALIASRQDPAEWVHRFARRLISARLSDAAASGERRPVGDGDLDVADYRVAVDLASEREGPVVLDLRGLAAPLSAAVAARQAWERASFPL